MKKIDGKNIRFTYLLIVVASFIIFGSNIWGVDIYMLDEAKNAECAREMLENKEFIVPTFNNELRTDKPPLHYYFMMLAYSIFGVNAFAARFFSVIMGIGTVLISFYYTNRHVNYKTALYTAFVLLASINFVLEFHLAVPDPYLIFFFCLSVFAFYDFLETKNAWSRYLIYISMALATLSKGPIAIALPGLIFLITLLIRKQLTINLLKELHIIRGILLFMAIALPWYFAVAFKTDFEWTRGFFLDHNINRFSESREGHGGTFLRTPLFVLIGMLPFSIFLFGLVKKFRLTLSDRFLHYMFLSAAVIVGFFSVSNTKLPNYPMPSYPFWAVIFASLMANMQIKDLKQYTYLNALASVLVFTGIFFLIKLERDISFLAAKSLLMLSLPIVSIILIFVKLNKAKLIHTVFFNWVIALLILFYGFYPIIHNETSIEKTKAIVPPDASLAYYQRFNAAFPFNYEKTLKRLESIEAVDSFLLHTPNAFVITTHHFDENTDSLKYGKELLRTEDLFERRKTVVFGLKH